MDPKLNLHLTPDGDGAGAGGAAVATAGGDAGGGQSGGAPVASGAGDGGGDGGNAGGAPAAQSWEGQPIPAEMAPLYQGVTTLGELHKRYQASSQEARQQREMTSKLQEAYIERLTNFSRQPQAVQPQATQPARSDVPGFASEAEFRAAYAASPVVALRTMQQASAKQAIEEYFKANVQPRFQQQQQALQEQQTAIQQQRQQETWAAFEKEYPEFKTGSPLHQAMAKALEDDPALVEYLGKNHARGLRMLAGQIKGAIAQQQNKANETRLAETRGRSGTARPGASANGQPKKGSFEERIRASAAQARANGEQITDEDIERRIDAGRSMGLK